MDWLFFTVLIAVKSAIVAAIMPRWLRWVEGNQK